MSTQQGEINETFKKRSGTTDVGKYYEDLIVSHLILELLNNPNVLDFQISSNDSDYGAFDDVVLEVKTSAETRKYALQLKHLNKTHLQDVALTNPKGNFSIQKYFQDFNELKPSIKEGLTLILFTNLKFEGERTINLEGKDVQVLQSPHFEDFQQGNCYRFEIDGGEYVEFFKHFFLYTNQANFAEIEKTTLENFQEMFKCEKIFAEKYLNFIGKWSQQEGKKTKLNKSFMQQAIAVHLLTPLLVSYSFSEGISESKKLTALKDAILQFNVTIVAKNQVQRVQKLWANVKISPEDEKSLLKAGRDFHVISDTIKTDTDKCKLLWITDKCPLVVTDHETSRRIINLCHHKKFIILEEESCRESLHNSVFQTLTDLDSSCCQNLTKIFKCSLQGKPAVSLKTLLGPESKKLVTVNHLIDMLDDSFVIGERESLPEPYVKRILTKRFVSHEYLKNHREDTLIVISCMNRLDKIVHHLGGLSLIKTKDRHLGDISSKKIFIDEDQCSREEFVKICAENPNKKQFYHFKIIDDDGKIECVDDKGESDSNMHIEDQKMIGCESTSKINVIYGHSGIGKSVLMKFFKNNHSSGSWVILISVKDYVPYLSKKVTDVDHFVDYLVSKNDKFEQEITKILLGKGQVTLLWDGLDEVSEEILQTVIFIIQEFERRKVHQWLSCSHHLLPLLERRLEISALRIRPFTDLQMITYIENRLSEKKLQDRLLSSMENVQHNGIVGVSIQIFMLTELLRSNSANFSILMDENQVYSIANLYEKYIENELKRHLPEEEDFDEWKATQIRRYEKVAMTTIFEEAALEAMKISWDEEDEDEPVPIDHRRPNFFHFSDLEYFAATYLHKASPPNLRRILSNAKYTNVRFMLDLILSADSSPHLATLYNNLDLLKKYEVNTCKNQLLQLSSSWGDSYLAITSFLIGCGADVNSRDSDGSAPLHLASANGHLETVRLLANHRETLLNPVDKWGDTPLRVAYNNRHLGVVRLLLQHGGVDKNGADVNGDRLIHLASKDGEEEVVRMLVLAGGVAVNSADKEGFTPIHLACQRGNAGVVRALLLSAATDVNAADVNGARPIHLACLEGHSDVARALLLAPAIDVNVVDKDGSRPIHLVCEKGRGDVARMLLMSEGVNVKAGNVQGKTPVDIARERGFEDITRLFAL